MRSPAHRTRAERPAAAKTGEQQGGKALRQGVADYFAQIVWAGINKDDAMRKRVEGTFHHPDKKVLLPDYEPYREAANGERRAGIVGLPNLAGAFFQGGWT